jgi:hypothetical protein
MANTFILKIDDRSKELMVQTIREKLVEAENAVIAGDYSDQALLRYEEFSILVRGLISARPQPKADAGAVEAVDIDAGI